MDNVTLQKADKSDIPTLIAAEQTTVGARTYSALVTEEDWKEELGKGVTYLIRAQDELVGHISYEQKSDTHVYISGLVIRPEFQRKGYARAAVKKLITEHSDAKQIDLVTHPDGPAVGLYESLGFVIEGRKENYFGDGEPRVVMALVRG